ncbi:zinc-type alcohol dehydrogenase subunit E [Mycobacterium tuberculosis variant bovis BCG]|nr:zinc-type alcohol dehydrogenase subunit E [Mycobacterium tuberculosis variant bovis BCG]
MPAIRGAVLDQIGVPRPYWRSKPISVVELRLDPPDRGEVLVRIEAAGVCHSDLSVVDGTRVRPVPILLGHEAAGIVEQVGDGVDGVAVGQRVVLVFLPRCGQCAACATDGRTPCEPGSAANKAGTLLGGGIRLSRAAARCTTTSASRVSRPMSSSTGPAWFRCRTRCRPPSLPYSGARCSPVGCGTQRR